MKNYKAYIATNKETKAFDFAYGKSEQTAVAAVRRKNSSNWHSCVVWCVYVHPNGEEEKL